MAGACFRNSNHANVNRNNYDTILIYYHCYYIFIEFGNKMRNVRVSRFMTILEKLLEHLIFTLKLKLSLILITYKE